MLIHSFLPSSAADFHKYSQFNLNRYIKVSGTKKREKRDEKEVEVIEGVILSTVNTVSVIAVTVRRKLWQSCLFFLYF